MIGPEYLDFRPDGRRGRAVQIEMSRRLGRSLRHVHAQARGPAGLREGGIDHLLAVCETGSALRPEVFAIHSDILKAVEDDDLDGVRALFGELSSGRFERETLCIRPFGPPEFGPVSRGRYLRYAATDPDVPLDLAAPDPREAEDFSKRVAAARRLIARAAPGIGAEIDAVVAEIVVATVAIAVPEQFDGISTFDLWGALFINPRRHPTVLDTAEILVHEAAHAVLFGFCLDEPLVCNPITERFASPVRADARPMDGVFHGTYVIASLHNLLRQLSAAGVLSADQEATAASRMRLSVRSFAEGAAVIRRHGDLTATGRHVLASIEGYMSAFA